MTKKILWVVFLLSLAFGGSYGETSPDEATPTDLDRDRIISAERSALDRWIRSDPQGYLDLFAVDVTYFDPSTERRVDGRKAMEARLAPMRNAKRGVIDTRYEMIDPRVQLDGDIALLTFNLVNYGKLPDQPEEVLARWNSTEVYSRIDGNWKIIHSHWSYVRPEIRQPGN